MSPRYDEVPANLTRDGTPIPPLRPTPSGMGDPLPPGGLTMEELLMGNYAQPGQAGVTIITNPSNRTIYFSDLFRLGEKYGGIEFSLTREVGPGGNNVYRLYSGVADEVTTPFMVSHPTTPGPVLRRLGHNHPSRLPFPGRGDMANINNNWLNMLMQDPYAPPPMSRIIWGAGDNSITPYFPNVLR